MFAQQVKMDEDDLAQELRVRVWRSMEQFSAKRSTWIGRGQEAALKGYVYLAVSNKIKDYKRDAARAKENDRVGKSVQASMIEDIGGGQSQDGALGGGSPQDWFDALYNFATHDEVYGPIEREPFTCPVELSHREHAVAAMLALGYDREECAIELGCSRAVVNETVSSLRRNLADHLG